MFRYDIIVLWSKCSVSTGPTLRLCRYQGGRSLHKASQRAICTFACSTRCSALCMDCNHCWQVVRYFSCTTLRSRPSPFLCHPSQSSRFQPLIHCSSAIWHCQAISSLCPRKHCSAFIQKSSHHSLSNKASFTLYTTKEFVVTIEQRIPSSLVNLFKSFVRNETSPPNHNHFHIYHIHNLPL